MRLAPTVAVACVVAVAGAGAASGRLADRKGSGAGAGASGSAAARSQDEGNWPSFRGPRASGVADGNNPPLSWSVDDGTNLWWRTPVPGVGHSSPVIWGGRVFVSTAVSSSADAAFVHGLTDTSASANDDSVQSWRLYCLDLGSGTVLWVRTLKEGRPRVQRHVKGSFANPTPATDGEHVVASFGSEGLYGLDMDGNVLWERDLGVLDGGWSSAPGVHWGYGSSPIIWEGLVIVQADAQNQAYVAAFDVASGDPVWRVERGEDTSWSTPSIVDASSGAELVLSGTNSYQAYDPRTGEELWRLADGVDVKIPTPIVADGLLLVGGGSAVMRPPFYALRPGARGTIDPHGAAPGDGGGAAASSSTSGPIVWRNDARPHVVTPIAYRGFLYVCTDNGILTLYDLATGERRNRLRLGGRGASFSASPVAADGHVYFASEDGDVLVLAAGPEGELLASNPMGEVIFATPAIAAGVMVIRTQSHVFAIGAARQ